MVKEARFAFLFLLLSSSHWLLLAAGEALEEDCDVDDDHCDEVEPVALYSNIWAVEVAAGADPDAVASDHGFVNEGPVLPDENIYEFKRHGVPAVGTQEHHDFGLSDDPRVVWSEQQTLEEVELKGFFLPAEMPRRIKRLAERNFYFNDPMWPDAWHLHPNDGLPTMNIEGAWSQGFTGAGVGVVHVDDGLDYTHPDLVAAHDPALSYDVANNDRDVYPEDHKKDRHGTSMAGIVAARANNTACTVGIAHGAKVGCLRVLAGDSKIITDAEQARSLTLAKSSGARVIVFGSGPPDSGSVVAPMGPLRRAALDKVTQGDGPKALVQPAGNGGRFSDTCAFDAHSNSIYTMAVNAVGERGSMPPYAENCTAVIASTFSAGRSPERYMVTAEPGGGCTNAFSGTSSSGAVAGGVMALLLEANPRLGWRDVQHLVVRSVRPRSELASAVQWQRNAAGRYYSPTFGFGLIDVGALTKNAVGWPNVPRQESCTLENKDRFRVEAQESATTSIAVTSSNCGSVRYLEHVVVQFSARARKRGDLQMALVSAGGTRSMILPSRRFDYSRQSFKGWEVLTMELWGEEAAGQWTLEVSHRGEIGGRLTAPLSFRGWNVTLYGTSTKV